MSPPSKKNWSLFGGYIMSWFIRILLKAFLFGHSWGSQFAVTLFCTAVPLSSFIIILHFARPFQATPNTAKYLCQATSWHPHNWSSSAAKTFRRHVWWPCSQDVLGGFYLILRLNLARDPRWMGDDSLFTFRRIPKVLQERLYSHHFTQKGK